MSRWDKVLSRLQGLREGKDGFYAAFCPKCEPGGGRSRSLSVKVCSDRLLLRCHSPQACPFPDIAQALALDESDFFEGGGEGLAPRRALKFLKAYSYRDERERLVFQAVRWLDEETGQKTFSQRRPNPAYDRKRPRGPDNRPWLRGIDGCRPLLYRLPELRRALAQKPARWVLVVEGEKAADSVAALGFTTTCNAMGAGKWWPEHSDLLAGCNVAVFPDADEPGRQHGLQACLSLFGVAAQVRLVPLPGAADKWGLDDFLEKTCASDAERVARVHALVSAAPEWEPAWEAVPRVLALVMAEASRVRRRQLVKDSSGLYGRFARASETLQGYLGAVLDGQDHDPADLAREVQRRAVHLMALLAVGLEEVVGLKE